MNPQFRQCILVVAVIGLLVGCQKNVAPFAVSAPNNQNGSYQATNQVEALPDITLLDQNGHAIKLSSLKGKPVLMDFIYTRCTTACPLLTAKFASIARLLGPRLGSDVIMVSITIDPEHDHPSELLNYADSHGAAHKGWLFLTGNLSDIERVLGIFGLKRQMAPDGSIDHVATAFLIGPDGHEERLYNALDVAPQTVVSDISRAVALE